jgi:hypothetical protein
MITRRGLLRTVTVGGGTGVVASQDAAEALRVGPCQRAYEAAEAECASAAWGHQMFTRSSRDWSATSSSTPSSESSA